MSERLTGELPPEWADLARADASEPSPPRGAKERGNVARPRGLGAGFLAATTAGSTAAAAGLGAGAAGGGAGAVATGGAGSPLGKKLLGLGIVAAVGVGGGTAAYLEVRSQKARSRAPVTTPAPAPAPVARPVAPPAPEPPPAELPPDTLGEERGLLDRARHDISRGLLAEAGVLLERHAAEFPSGQLAEEREALVIRLLIREGREGEARSRAARVRR